MKEVIEKHRGKIVVAVTHGDIIAFTALWAKGQKIDPSLRIELKTIAGFSEEYPGTASLTVLSIRQSLQVTDLNYFKNELKH